LSALARLEERASLEDHPEFPAKLEIILDALDATLRQFGVEPVGAREAFVAHVDELEKRIARAA
jgi:molecular chaperone GrpE (heat shock protein)